MKNKSLIAIIIILLLLIGAGAFYLYMSMTHNMSMGDMEDGNNDAMRAHCQMMPEMKGCEKYINEVKNDHHMGSMVGMPSGETFDESIDGLPDAKKSEIIILKDGDTYEMIASAVKQELGNRTVKRLAYNGMIPGPLLQVEKGEKINLKLTNNLDVDTTLHSHGLRLDDSKFDGLPTTMQGEQVPMKKGDSFTYELNFPDTGVFWYHPHIREDYTQEMGLYGNFSVVEEGYWSTVDREEFLILDDFGEDDVFYKEKVNKTLMGRFGNIMLINNDEDYKLKLNTGEISRLYLTNVANTRTFDFTISKNGENIDFKLVGGDIGRIEKEVIIDHQIISPAERYIIETVFNEPGTYEIKSKDRKLGEIIVTGDESNTSNLSDLRNNGSDYRDIRDRFQAYLDKKADKKLELTISMNGMKDGMMMGDEEGHNDDGIEWEDEMREMNLMSSDQTMEWKLLDPETGNENMDIQWNFKKGDFVKVEIFNDPKSMHPMQHPIHFHGQRFIVLTRDGVVNDNLQWKDTTLIRNGEKIEILIEMTNVGLWMSHCHIAEHLQSGMMMNFTVEENLSNSGDNDGTIITLNAKKWEFDTKEIRVKKGEKLTIKVNNTDILHGIAIPDMMIMGDDEIEVDTSQTGEFLYRCYNYCGEGHQDMIGKLIIE
ncbi:hypothetical protein A9Q91_02760 [Candidatus Gracilibacteria bacterium 28_42_T64]|nr:hypothetical protein A9Q91_02760 [Candidatus Gracilibacteria bacterium 28_42_T64]